MNEHERMTIDERMKFLRLMQKRYQDAGRAEKKRLLDEAVAMTGLHRKSLVRLLNDEPKRKRRVQQRGRTYGLSVQAAIRVISESVDHICPERLQPNLAWLAEHLVRHGEMEVNDELLAQLDRISVSSVRRILGRLSQDTPRLPRRPPQAANEAAKRVPIGLIPWNQAQPGHFEVDLVHHCGPVADGHYVHSLQMIDVATGWSERVALLGRSQRVMVDGFTRILIRLPFPVRHIHTDNGSEFLNDQLLLFWHEIAEEIILTRGRPYQKNDQRFVEQKNDTLIRAYLGHQRLDTAVQTYYMNLLYTKMWLFYNFFQPVMHLAEKSIVTTETGGRRVLRRHDVARTPFDRVCEAGVLSPGRKQELDALRQRTNPRKLCEEIHNLTDHILSLPGAAPGKTEDVFRTLLTSEEVQRLRWAAGHMGELSEGYDLPTYPLNRRNGNGKGNESFKVKEMPVTISFERTNGLR
jgi:hypothetical protein